MDIASPWDHRAYEKEGEKIEKYQDLKREIRRLWGISCKLLLYFNNNNNNNNRYSFALGSQSE